MRTDELRPQAAPVRVGVLRRPPWDRERRVVVKAEHNAFGANRHFVVTDLEHTDRHLYDRIYCVRGDMENRIKHQQLDLFAGRASWHRFWANQGQQLLSGLAYAARATSGLDRRPRGG